MSYTFTTAAIIATAIITTAIIGIVSLQPAVRDAGPAAPTPGTVISSSPAVRPTAWAAGRAVRAGQMSGADVDLEASRDQPIDEAGTMTIVGASKEQRETVAWAIAHFAEADLELPTLTIEFHPTDDGCDGYDGAFRSRETPARLDVCNPYRLIVLHELAHAWEHTAISDQVRREFMAAQGITAWNDGDLPWKERGVEEMAEVLVWGLRQLGGTTAIDVQPEKEHAFELATGIDLTTDRYETAVAKSHTVFDPAEADPGWDTLS